MATHFSTLAWKIPWMEEPGRLQSMGSQKSQTWLSELTFTFHSHALEKELATHSSVLAWRIPGTGEPGGLLSMGSHRVEHDWSDLAAAYTAQVFFLYFSYIFNILATIKDNMPEMLLSFFIFSIKMATQKIHQFWYSFFKYTMICQLSQYSLTKLFPMMVKGN